MFPRGCRSRINRCEAPHAVGDAQSGKSNKGELSQLLEQGRLLLLRREIVEIDGDVAGMLLQARRVALGEQTCRGEGRQGLLFCFVVLIFAVLSVVGPDRIRHKTHIEHLSTASGDSLRRIHSSSSGRENVPTGLRAVTLGKSEKDLPLEDLSVVELICLCIEVMSFREGRVDLEEGAAFSLLNTFFLHRVPVTLPFLPVLNKTLLYISLHWGVCQIVVGSARQVERNWKPAITF